MSTTIQDMTESYLSQADKLELQALLSCGSFEESQDTEDDQGGGECEESSPLSYAEYSRCLCSFDRNDAVRNGLHPAHVSSARRSLPVGWTW